MKIWHLASWGDAETAVGLEALTTPLLARLGKPYNFERAVYGLLTLQEAGIKFRAHLRCGFGEGEGDVADSIANLEKLAQAGLRRLRADFGPLVHYEGTRLREEADYELAPLPDRDVECLVMARPPDWSPLTDALRARGWLTFEGLKK